MADETVVSPNEAEVAAPDAATVEVEETVEEVRAKLAKAEELAKNYKIRAEKAEGKVKEPKAETTQAPTQPQVVTQDDLVLSRSNVHDDDFETVKKFARMEGISVKEALNSEDLKAVLERRTNLRKTAEVANTNPARRTATKVDDSTLLARASKGDVPEPGSAEAERLFWARRGGKR